MTPMANDIVRLNNPGWNPVGDMMADAARYRWLRDDNAYAPEEAYVRGGEDLDALCDAGMRRDAEPPPPKPPRFRLETGHANGRVVELQFVHVPSACKWIYECPAGLPTLAECESIARYAMCRLLEMASPSPVHPNCRCVTRPYRAHYGDGST